MFMDMDYKKLKQQLDDLKKEFETFRSDSVSKNELKNFEDEKKSDSDSKDQLEVYRTNNYRQSDRALNQLSFVNSLFITLAVGFIALAFEELLGIDLGLGVKSADWSLTMLVISFLLLSASVAVGLFAAHNRLIHFRISRHISLTRRRVYKFSKTKLSEEIVKPELSKWKRFKLQYDHFNFYREIELDECLGYSSFAKKGIENEFTLGIDERFLRLRKISESFGKSTWSRVNWQGGLFLFGFLVYIFSNFIELIITNIEVIIMQPISTLIEIMLA